MKRLVYAGKSDPEPSARMIVNPNILKDLITGCYELFLPYQNMPDLFIYRLITLLRFLPGTKQQI